MTKQTDKTQQAELTRARIEDLRIRMHASEYLGVDETDALCDMALSALTAAQAKLEAGYACITDAAVGVTEDRFDWYQPWLREHSATIDAARKEKP